MSDLTAGFKAIADAAAAYVEAHSYYTGDVAEVMPVESGLTRQLARTGRRYRLNFAKTPVTVVSDRLEIAAVTVPGDKQATEALQTRVWDANGLLLETPEANRLACVYGDYYMVVWPGEKDGTVDVWFNSPVTMRVVYDPENPRRKAYAVKRWRDGDLWRATLYYPNRIERYVTAAPNMSGERDTDWVEYRDNDSDVWPIPNPHGEVPVFHLRTTSPYGTPVHRDAYGPQDAINKVVITMMSANDYAGFPLRYALIDGDARLEGEAGFAPTWDDETEATEANRDRLELPTGPGNVWLAQGLKGVGQLSPADPKHFLDPAEFLIRAMAQTTTTPLHYFDPSGDQPSGESLRTADAPLTKRARLLQMWLASPYSDGLSFALRILGYPNAKVDVRWVPATSTDDRDSWTTAGLKLAAGVPVRQVLLEQGYTAEQVDEWIASTGEDNLRQQVLLLVELGKAVQSLGAGASLGAVNADTIRDLVDNVLAAVNPPELPAAS